MCARELVPARLSLAARVIEAVLVGREKRVHVVRERCCRVGAMRILVDLQLVPLRASSSISSTKLRPFPLGRAEAEEALCSNDEVFGVRRSSALARPSSLLAPYAFSGFGTSRSVTRRLAAVEDVVGAHRHELRARCSDARSMPGLDAGGVDRSGQLRARLASCEIVERCTVHHRVRSLPSQRARLRPRPSRSARAPSARHAHPPRARRTCGRHRCRAGRCARRRGLSSAPTPPSSE